MNGVVKLILVWVTSPTTLQAISRAEQLCYFPDCSYHNYDSYHNVITHDHMHQYHRICTALYKLFILTKHSEIVYNCLTQLRPWELQYNANSIIEIQEFLTGKILNYVVRFIHTMNCLRSVGLFSALDSSTTVCATILNLLIHIYMLCHNIAFIYNTYIKIMMLRDNHYHKQYNLPALAISLQYAWESITNK